MSQAETGGTVPTPGKGASLEELKAAYRSMEQSDAPEVLKERVLMDLADRIREYDRPKRPQAEDSGEFFIGAPTEAVTKSGFRGRLLDSDGQMVKAKL